MQYTFIQICMHVCTHAHIYTSRLPLIYNDDKTDLTKRVPSKANYFNCRIAIMNKMTLLATACSIYK